MQLERCWVLFGLNEDFSKTLRKHFEYSDISEEKVVGLEKASLVFVLSVVLHQLVVAHNFRKALRGGLGNLLFNFSIHRVLHKQTSP